MNKVNSIKRTMIILWKWYVLENNSKGYDVVNVAKSEDNKIIRVNIRHIQKVIDLIIQLTSEQEGDVFIFLHRNHSLNESHVETILHQLQSSLNGRRIKCFLFSSARDFIYYQVKKEGLLDSVGFFADGDFKFEDKDGNEYEEEVSVLKYDDNGELLGVKYQHFNRTWQYYQNEFYEKIKSLGVDMMTRLTLNEAIKSELTVGEWHEYLSKFITTEDKLVWYRLKNLLGYYAFSGAFKDNSLNTLQKELENLKEYEKETELSFAFDDVKVNLEEHYRPEVQKAYGKLSKKLKPITENSNQTTIISIEEMRNVFDELLKAFE